MRFTPAVVGATACVLMQAGIALAANPPVPNVAQNAHQVAPLVPVVGELPPAWMPMAPLLAAASCENTAGTPTTPKVTANGWVHCNGVTTYVHICLQFLTPSNGWSDAGCAASWQTINGTNGEHTLGNCYPGTHTYRSKIWNDFTPPDISANASFTC